MGLLAQKEITIDEVTYTLQRIPFKSYLEINDRCTNKNGVLMKTPYAEELFKHCVVVPKVKLADFDENVPAGMELVGEIESFLNTKGESSADQEAGK